MDQIPVVQVHTPGPASQGKFHVRLTSGYFQNLRRAISWPLLALFFAIVWIRVDGQPWLMFSFEQRRIILFGNGIAWHDLPVLTALLVAGACLLFFVAVGWGRVWCGFACPQSIWTWLFIRIENLCEGKANRRARRQGRATGSYTWPRSALKHFLWIALSLCTALTFSGYFLPIETLIDNALRLQLPAHQLAWIGIMGALTYLNAGLVREKICLHACPYSRFQSAMFDSDTRTVSYDARRGEARASRRKRSPESGDCVDCSLCVQVCPTGIDIRDGLQSACIDCGACIDACDGVMKNLGRAGGLIRFTSESLLAGRDSPLLRPRLAAYFAVALLASGFVIYGFSQTRSLLVEIRRDRQALFTQVDSATTCNHYAFKLEGVGTELSRVAVSLSNPDSFELIGPLFIDLPRSDSRWIPYDICTSKLSEAPRNLAVEFNSAGQSIVKHTTFLSQTR